VGHLVGEAFTFNGRVRVLAALCGFGHYLDPELALPFPGFWGGIKMKLL
jgi:hypothetical protein